MKHFDITQWADFVHGLVAEAERTAMEEHLTSGCRKCQRTTDLLRNLVAVAGAEAQYEAPQHLVHSARAMYALQQPERVDSLPRLVARLVYASFREPLPAGVRTRYLLSHQALYRAGDLSLDFRLDHERGSRHAVLVGQIANRKEPRKRMIHVPVFLVSGKQIVARAVTNQLGEFHLEYEPKARLRLCVSADDGKCIEVSLHRLLADNTKGKVTAKTQRSSKKEKSGSNRTKVGFER